MQFSIAVRCEVCQGKGKTETTVHAQDIMLIVLHNVKDGKVQKLDAIKQLRNEHGIDLKPAKELVEGAMDFLYAIEKHASQIPIREVTEGE